MNDYIKLRQENIDLRLRLIEELKYSKRMIEEKIALQDRMIERNKRMIKTLELFQIALDAMQTIIAQMHPDDPNKEILNNAFSKIAEGQTKMGMEHE